MVSNFCLYPKLVKDEESRLRSPIQGQRPFIPVQWMEHDSSMRSSLVWFLSILSWSSPSYIYCMVCRLLEHLNSLLYWSFSSNLLWYEVETVQEYVFFFWSNFRKAKNNNNKQSWCPPTLLMWACPHEQLVWSSTGNRPSWIYIF